MADEVVETLTKEPMTPYGNKQFAQAIMLNLTNIVIEVNMLNPSRERSMVLTSLDEARHWLRDIHEKITFIEGAN